jgi:hypothetical protein
MEAVDPPQAATLQAEAKTTVMDSHHLSLRQVHRRSRMRTVKRSVSLAVTAAHDRDKDQCRSSIRPASNLLPFHSHSSDEHQVNELRTFFNAFISQKNNKNIGEFSSKL